MPSLTFSQESFDEKLPSSLSKRVSRPDLKTTKLKHLSIESSEEQDTKLLNLINKQISRSRKILVLTGAGISCNAGIPDFRSSNGLYDLVKQEYPDVSIRSGQEMFDISLFREEEKISVFATFMEKLYSSTRLAQPTRTHRFIAHLKNRGKLLRCYTQNIDGLEEHLGLEISSCRKEESTVYNQWKSLDVVQLHGDLNKLSCTQCFEVYPWSRLLSRYLRNGELPSCPRCHQTNIQRSMLGKRNSGSIGLLRPNIVLYGENHPSCEFIAQGLNIDIGRGKPDLFFIMGTSLKVDGVKKLVRNISKQVHERGGLVILINKTKIGDCNWHGIIDYQMACDCDDWVEYLKQQLPDFFKTQQEIDKIRQLKRQNSELRKRQKEERKLTPPSTPRKANMDNTLKHSQKRFKKDESIPGISTVKLSPDSCDYIESSSLLAKLNKDEEATIIVQKRIPFETVGRTPLQTPPFLAREREISSGSFTDITEDEVPTDIDEDVPLSFYRPCHNTRISTKVI